MTHLFIVGSTNVDLTLRVARLPGPGETLMGQSLVTGFGGKGGNQAVMAARLGAQVTFLSGVGQDAFGEKTQEHYRSQGIDVSHLHTFPGPTGTAIIVVDESAQNTIVVVPGANALLTLDHVHRAVAQIQSSTLAIAQMETPIDVTYEVFRLAHQAGRRTLLNPAPAADVSDELLALTDLCVPNETELRTLTGLPTDTQADVERASRRLQARCRPDATVIVTLGEHGAFVLTSEASWLCPTPTVEARDPTAAGDAFIGSLAVFLGDGETLTDAVRRACAVAALTVTRPGAQDSFPTREEIAEVLTRPSR